MFDSVSSLAQFFAKHHLVPFNPKPVHVCQNVSKGKENNITLLIYISKVNPFVKVVGGAESIFLRDL